MGWWSEPCLALSGGEGCEGVGCEGLEYEWEW